MNEPRFSSDDQPIVDRIRAGDETASRQVYDRFVEKLLGLARRRISARIASRIDPEDVVQSVFRTFFQRTRDGEWALSDDTDLAKLLVRITIHKTLRQIAFHQAAQRDPQRECSTIDATGQRSFDLEDRDPSPEEAILFLDQLEHFLGQLSPLERQVVELKLQGYGTEEIAVRLDTYDRKVRRVLERLKSVAAEEGFLESEGAKP